MQMQNSFIGVIVGGVTIVTTLIAAVWQSWLSSMEGLLLGVAVLVIGHMVFLFMKPQAPALPMPGAAPQPSALLQLHLRQEKNRELHAKFNDAVYVLKNSKLVKSFWKGNAPYKLPWYLLLGPPGNGKSELLRRSRLHFPSVNPKAPDQKLQGLEGTKNLDFWFTTEALILDTAGRYMQPRAESEEQDEWKMLALALKKRHRRRPLDGVILAVSLADDRADRFNLLLADDEKIEQQAKYLRHALDELMKAVKQRLPVYLAFTKCDQLYGFMEFFSGLKEDERDQIMGCTFSRQEQHEPAEKLVRRELETLTQALCHWRLFRLGHEHREEFRRKIYGFPLEFAEMREKLARFVAALMHDNPFQLSPILRGFYFTSALQTQTPNDRLIRSKAEEFGLTPAVEEATPVERKRVASYFIRDLFTRLIIPEQGLAGPLAATQRRWTAADIAVAATVLVMLGVVVFFLIQS